MKTKFLNQCGCGIGAIVFGKTQKIRKTIYAPKAIQNGAILPVGKRRCGVIVAVPSPKRSCSPLSGTRGSDEGPERPRVALNRIQKCGEGEQILGLVACDARETNSAHELFIPIGQIPQDGIVATPVDVTPSQETQPASPIAFVQRKPALEEWPQVPNGYHGTKNPRLAGKLIRQWS